ncbi:MAG TPA: hypothetical protein VN428_08920 [Bryobacteraceae bacterium]|nr:hypothetical protein [Bryobacteraceae bacterium]
MVIDCNPKEDLVDTLHVDLPTRAPSYQSAPLIDYSPVLQRRAEDLFGRIVQHVGPVKALRYKGSYSVISSSGDHTAAKIVIVEDGKGKVNGDSPPLCEGVYVLIRTQPSKARRRTIGLAPKHEERFAYFRFVDGLDLDEVAAFIAACSE